MVRTEKIADSLLSLNPYEETWAFMGDSLFTVFPNSHGCIW